MKNRNVLLLECGTYKKMETDVAHDSTAHTHSLKHNRLVARWSEWSDCSLEWNRNNSSNNNMVLDSNITSFSDGWCSQVTPTTTMTNAIEFLFLFRVQTEIFANVLIMSSSAPSRLCCYALFILIALCRIFLPPSSLACFVLFRSAPCTVASHELHGKILFILERFCLEIEIDLNVKYTERKHMYRVVSSFSSSNEYMRTLDMLRGCRSRIWADTVDRHSNKIKRITLAPTTGNDNAINSIWHVSMLPCTFINLLQFPYSGGCCAIHSQRLYVCTFTACGCGDSKQVYLY